jgi:hypothetical protein
MDETPTTRTARPGLIAAFVLLALGLVGWHMCPTGTPPAARPTTTDVADVRGTSMRATAPVAPTPAAQAPIADSPTAPPAADTPPRAAPLPRAPVAVAETPPAAPAAASPEAVAPPPSPAPIAKQVEEKPAPKTAEKPRDPNKVVKVTWDDISQYKYVPPDPDSGDGSTSVAGKDQIPADIRAMSGTKIEIEGYAVPLDFEKGIATKFILLPAPLACCFAEAPPMNRWITVANVGKSDFDSSKYAVIRVSGAFDVGEETREGYVIGIYRVKADKIENVEQ